VIPRASDLTKMLHQLPVGIGAYAVFTWKTAVKDMCVCAMCDVVGTQRVGQVERSQRRRSSQTSAAWTGAELETVSRRALV